MRFDVPLGFCFSKFVALFFGFRAAEFCAVFRRLGLFAGGFDPLFGFAEIYDTIRHVIGA